MLGFTEAPGRPSVSKSSCLGSGNCSRRGRGHICHLVLSLAVPDSRATSILETQLVLTSTTCSQGAQNWIWALRSDRVGSAPHHMGPPVPLGLDRVLRQDASCFSGVPIPDPINGNRVTELNDTKHRWQLMQKEPGSP